MSNSKNREKVCEIIACLMKGERTIREIEEMVDVSNKGAREWANALHKVGLVGISCLRKGGQGVRGHSAAVYQWQRYPFELEDFAP